MTLNQLERQYSSEKELSFTQELELLKGFDRATQIEILSNKRMELIERLAPHKAYIKEALERISKLPQQEQPIYKSFLELYLPPEMNKLLKRQKRLELLWQACLCQHGRQAIMPDHKDSPACASTADRRIAKLEQFEEMKQQAKSVSILTIAERLGYTPIRKGSRYFISCPFHNEQTASCCLYTDSNRFYCYGCHAKGDVLDFYQGITKTDFKATVKELTEI